VNYRQGLSGELVKPLLVAKGVNLLWWTLREKAL